MESNLEVIARVVHEVNKAYCESIGDFSQKSWSEAEQWQRDSAVAGVHSMLVGEATSPADQHELWCRHKEADGWVWGAEKDAGAKTHPCLVPYYQLPEYQKRKDHLFRAVVRALTEPV